MNRHPVMAEVGGTSYDTIINLNRKDPQFNLRQSLPFRPDPLVSTDL